MDHSVNNSAEPGNTPSKKADDRPKISVRRSPIVEFLETEVYPRLTPEHVYFHSSHQWKNQSARKWQGGCCFHASVSGTSFSVDTETLLFYCAGCHFGGGPIQYLARLKGIAGKVRGQDFIDLVRELAVMAGVELPKAKLTADELQHLAFLEARRRVLEVVLAKSVKNLWSPCGQVARTYLTTERGFTEDEIRDLRLGLFVSVEQIRVALKDADLDLDVARESGVLSDKWANYITIPWCDESGAALTIYGRYQAKSPPDDLLKTLALPGEQSKRSPLFFDRARRAGHKHLVLVEGVLDAAMAQVRGDTSVVACVGAQLSVEQVNTLKRCRIESVTVELDPDSAGDKGIVSCVRSLREAGIDVYVAKRLPDGLDPDQFIIKFGIDEWRKHVADRVPGDVHRLQLLVSKHRGAGEFTDATLQAFLDEAKSEGLGLEAARFITDEFVQAATEDPEHAVSAVLQSPASLRSLAILMADDLRAFEVALTRLRDAKVKVKAITSLERVVREENKKLREERRKASRTPSASQENPLVPPELGAPVPPETRIPIGVLLDEKGISIEKTSVDGEISITRIATSPILIAARFKDLAEDIESLLLVWLRDGKWQRHIAPRAMVADTRSIVALAGVGFPVTSGNARDLVEYLAALERVNLDILQPRRVSRQMGWQGEKGRHGFLWGRTLISDAGERSGSLDLGETATDDWTADFIAFQAADAGEAQLVEGFQREGNFDAWKVAVGPVLPFPRAVTGLLVALCAPLLAVIGAPNPIASWSGRTSRGKTTTLRIAASCWGVPDETSPASLVRTWDSTRVFVERLGALYHSLPLFLDETGLAKNGSIVTQIVFAVAAGQGKGRGSPKGMRRTGAWTTALLSTGEEALASFSEKQGGTHARVLEQWGAPFGPKNQAPLVAGLNANVLRHYGHAGPAFIRYVIDHRDQWETWRDSYLDTVRDFQIKAGTNEVAGRLATTLAVLDLTARLADRDAAGVLPWSYFELKPAIESLWEDVRKGAENADRDREALRRVASWAHRHTTHFLGKHEATKEGLILEPHDGWAGRWGAIDHAKDDANDDVVAFFPDRLEELLRKWEFNPHAIIAAWCDRGWLKTSGTDRRRLQMRFLGKERPRFYAIRLSAIAEVESDPKPEDAPAGSVVTTGDGVVTGNERK